jgi:hypothetical protein
VLITFRKSFSKLDSEEKEIFAILFTIPSCHSPHTPKPSSNATLSKKNQLIKLNSGGEAVSESSTHSQELDDAHSLSLSS